MVASVSALTNPGKSDDRSYSIHGPKTFYQHIEIEISPCYDNMKILQV